MYHGNAPLGDWAICIVHDCSYQEGAISPTLSSQLLNAIEGGL